MSGSEATTHETSSIRKHVSSIKDRILGSSKHPESSEEHASSNDAATPAKGEKNLASDSEIERPQVAEQRDPPAVNEDSVSNAAPTSSGTGENVESTAAKSSSDAPAHIESTPANDVSKSNDSPAEPDAAASTEIGRTMGISLTNDDIVLSQDPSRIKFA